jgi:hypothetical protein
MAEDEAYYRRQASGLESQAEQRRLERRMAEAKLERLREARAVVSSEKGKVKAYIEDTSKKEDPPPDWLGLKARNHQGYVSSDLKGLNRTYYGTVDDLHDAIDAKITALENEVTEAVAGIAWLMRQANELRSWIRRNFN